MIYTYLPLMVLPLFVALERARPAAMRAAQTSARHRAACSGASCFRSAAPGIVAGCVLVGIPAAGEYVVPAILGGDKTLMYGNVVAASSSAPATSRSARRSR